MTSDWQLTFEGAFKGAKAVADTAIASTRMQLIFMFILPLFLPTNLFYDIVHLRRSQWYASGFAWYESAKKGISRWLPCYGVTNLSPDLYPVRKDKAWSRPKTYSSLTIFLLFADTNKRPLGYSRTYTYSTWYQVGPTGNLPWAGAFNTPECPLGPTAETPRTDGLTY